MLVTTLLPSRQHESANIEHPPTGPPLTHEQQKEGKIQGEFASLGGMRARQRAVFGLTGSVCVIAPTLPPNSQIQHLI